MGAPPVDSGKSGDVNNQNDDDYYDPDLDTGGFDNPPVDNTDKTGSAYKTGNNKYPQTNPTTGSKNLGMPGSGSGGSVAGGGDFSQPGVDPEVKDYVQQLKAQGFSPQQIHDAVKQTYGIDLSPSDVSYLESGSFPPTPSGYSQSYPMSKNLGTGYQSWGTDPMGGTDQQKLMKFLQDQQMSNDAKDMGRNMKKNDQEQKVKIHMILLQIMMGDIVGALRSYAVLRDRDARQFTRTIMDKLDKVRVARTKVIRNFANTTPPRAYAGNNPQQAARAQDRSSKYTQYVQMSTQLMSELQNTEKELVDAETTITRDNQTFWESYAGFRDQEFRTNDRVMSVR